MSDIDVTKAAFLNHLESVVAGGWSSSSRDLVDKWIDALSPDTITSLNFSFDPRQVDDYYSDDEIVFSKRFYFYEASYLRQCCTPGPDCLAGARCIPVGGVDDVDEFLFITDSAEQQIAILHRDDVFLTEDIDAVVADRANSLGLSLARFIALLRPETNLARLGVRNNAARWLVIEHADTTVRYECNLPGDWSTQGKAFDTADDARAFFLDTIRRAASTTELSILGCSHDIRDEVERLLVVSS